MVLHTRIVGWIFALVVAAAIPAFAQTGKSPTPGPTATGKDNLFQSVRPQIYVVIREHPTGADLVEITAVDPDYPRELLKTQIESLGQTLKNNARGLFVSDPRSANYAGTTKATFGIDGLIEGGRFQLTPLIRALAGALAPNSIEGVSVVYEKQRPTAETVRDFRSAAVDVQADAQPGSIGIEYRVHIKDQDPSKIEIPDSALATAQVANQSVPSGGPDMVTLIVIGVAAVAVGALVYSLTLRRPRQR